MGFGSYTAGDWSRLKESRKISSAASAKQIFKLSSMKPQFNPYYIDKREARDSDLHPMSTPIVIGVDVTGSMDYLSERIIKSSLNELMQQLYSTDIIKDPQIMFAAIGDAYVDKAPLQVTQFESDIRIAEQLMDLWLEGGGGDGPEDYELMWYFIDKHTDIDSLKKRGKKGFCFTIGDAECHPELKAFAANRIFNDKVTNDLLTTDIAKSASEKYNLYHIKIGGSLSTFDSIITGHVVYIRKQDVEYLPDIILSIMLLENGMSKEEVIGRLGSNAQKIVIRAISTLVLVKDGEINF